MLSRKETSKIASIRIRARSLTTSNGRASFLFSFPMKCRASLTLEASLVLPIFLFYIMTLLYSIEIVRFQSDVRQALYQEATRESFEAYAVRYADSGETTPGDALQNIKEYLEKQLLPYLCVEGGAEGLVFELEDDVMGKDNRRLSLSYRIKPFIYYLPIGDMVAEDSVLIHDFTGYQEDGVWNAEKNEIYVYITPTGKKYHLSETCTYLRVKLKALESTEADEYRNADGEKYKPCDICGTKENHIVYLTEWGNRYHGRADCEAIQKTVYVVPISQASGRTACSKCGD